MRWIACMHAIYLIVLYMLDCIHEVDSMQSCHDAIHVMVVRGGLST